MPVANPGRIPQLSTRDLLIIVAIVALGMAVGWPMVAGEPTPEVESNAMVWLDGNYLDPANTFGPPDIESCLSMATDYLHSPQAVQDVLEDPAVSSLPSPPPKAVVERCLQEEIRICRWGSVYLMKCRLSVDETERDTAILNAAASTLTKELGSGPGSWNRVVKMATAPASPVIRHSGPLGVMFSLAILGLTLTAFATARTFRGHISRIRHTRS